MLYWFVRMVSIIGMVLTISSICACLIGLAGMGIEYAIVGRASSMGIPARLGITGLCFIIPAYGLWLGSAAIADKLEESR